MASRHNIRLAFTLAAVLTSLLTTACGGGYTVYPVITHGSESREVASLDGIWLMNDADDYWAMRISHALVASRDCPEADIRVWEGSTSIDSEPMMQGRLCIAEIAGHTVAELMTVSDPRLFQHFLVRVERSRIAVCSAGFLSVWAIFQDGQKDQPPTFSLEDVEYTVRHVGETDEIFVISDSSLLEASLARNLPRLAQLCDDAEEDEDPRWLVFERVTPPPTEDAGGPDQPAEPVVRRD